MTDPAKSEVPYVQQIFDDGLAMMRGGAELEALLLSPEAVRRIFSEGVSDYMDTAFFTFMGRPIYETPAVNGFEWHSDYGTIPSRPRPRRVGGDHLM